DHIQAIRTAPQGHLVALFGDEVHPLVMQLTDGEVQAFCTPARKTDVALMSNNSGGDDGERSEPVAALGAHWTGS
ncbi:MAG: hypothetical protein M3Q08_17875, partial [Pseudomonadota bacterium]|nr:hypothetical protein [Pseudomonadota bacterium]